MIASNYSFPVSKSDAGFPWFGKVYSYLQLLVQIKSIMPKISALTLESFGVLIVNCSYCLNLSKNIQQKLSSRSQMFFHALMSTATGAKTMIT